MASDTVANVGHEKRKRAAKAYHDKKKKEAPITEEFAISGSKLLKLTKLDGRIYSTFVGTAKKEELAKYDNVEKVKAKLKG